MADNVELNPGTGGAIFATDDIGGVQYQRVKVTWGVDATATDTSAANPLPVVQTGTLNVGTVTAVTAISNALPAGTNNIGDVDVLTVPADPFGANADAASATGSISAKLRFIAATGIPVTGTVAVTQSGTWNIGSITTLPALVAGTANIGDVDVLTVPADPFGANADAASATGSISAKLRFIAATGIPITGTVTIASNSSVNCAQIAGTTTAVNNGTASAGCQRVTIASDNTAFTVNAAQSGTWTVQPGNTANTTAWLSSLRPGTSGGLTTFHLVSAGTTNATNIKGSAGQVFGWYIYNSNAAARKVAFHNTAGTPTAGSAVVASLVIPPTSAANVMSDVGIAFGTGIAITTVTDLTDAGSTAVAANDLIINIYYA